ncbi:unnamed protein product, partial [Prorocentrum cordatum]
MQPTKKLGRAGPKRTIEEQRVACGNGAWTLPALRRRSDWSRENLNASNRGVERLKRMWGPTLAKRGSRGERRDPQWQRGGRPKSTQLEDTGASWPSGIDEDPKAEWRDPIRTADAQETRSSRKRQMPGGTPLIRTAAEEKEEEEKEGEEGGGGKEERTVLQNISGAPRGEVLSEGADAHEQPAGLLRDALCGLGEGPESFAQRPATPKAVVCEGCGLAAHALRGRARTSTALSAAPRGGPTRAARSPPADGDHRREPPGAATSAVAGEGLEPSGPSAKARPLGGVYPGRAADAIARMRARTRERALVRVTRGPR